MNTTYHYKLETQDVSVWYGQKHALKGISMGMERNALTAFIGPSGCGKSTYLRLFNRMNDLIDNFRVEGRILLDDHNLYERHADPVSLRRQVGMVFQRPNPFPKSIFENIAYGLRVNGLADRARIKERVEVALHQADLWDEVKDNLGKSALELSGGQQQRLCIARALAVEPTVLLLDEPTSALDPISTANIEELLQELKSKYTLVMVTHNLHQAARISDHTAFFYLGELVEHGPTQDLFTNPTHERTEAYLTGRFG